MLPLVIAMHPSYQALFDQLQEQRNTLLSTFSSLNNDQLGKPPAPGQWSVLDVLNHLVTAEKLSIMYLQKKVQGIEQAADSGLWEDCKLLFFMATQRFPGLRFKAPTRVAENTSSLQSLEDIRKEWDKVRQDLHEVISSIPPQYSKRLIYKHPRIGYINPAQMLIFFREHVIHHGFQFKRILQKIS